MAFLIEAAGTRALAWRRIALQAAAALWLLGPPSARADPSLEYAVKATYLYKLAPFVAWPAESLGDSGQPLSICIQGADPFGALLDRGVAGQRVGARQISVRRMARIDSHSGCQIAYVAGSPVQTVAQALDAVQQSPVLTVTDDARSPTRGIFHLVLEGGKVRFSIDAARAEMSGLTISSKLLALALEVRR